MKRAWMLGAACAILFSVGCQNGKPELNEDFSDLNGADEKSDQFSKKMTVVGSLDYGQTSASVKYHNPAKYRAFKFGGHKGDQVTVDVTSKNGDSVAWLTDNAFKIVSKNDDFGDSFDSHIEATLPGNKNADIVTYYIIFTEYAQADATFKVKLQGKAVDFFACTANTDCVAEPEGGCCPHGYKVAVNKNQVASWQDSVVCTTVPRPICALYLVNDPRVAQCNATTLKCEMVEPHPTTTTCGGIAGIQCPAGQKCVDNPNDSCDPAHGGADCGGICVACVQTQLCIQGSHFDQASCGCVPDQKTCGGIANLQCPAGQKCVDNPNDSCDPAHGGADCGGICVACIQNVLCTVTSHFDQASCGCVPNQFCGGIAGIRCPTNFQCVDNPTDSCDPAHGGADCGGMCVPN
jgi:hypothetical protein